MADVVILGADPLRTSCDLPFWHQLTGMNEKAVCHEEMPVLRNGSLAGRGFGLLPVMIVGYVAGFLVWVFLAMEE